MIMIYHYNDDGGAVRTITFAMTGQWSDNDNHAKPSPKKPQINLITPPPPPPRPQG